MRYFLATVCLFAVLDSSSGHAQPTNLEGFQQLGVQCFEQIPDTLHAFQLEAPSTLPYLRSALVERWRRQQRRLFMADSVSRSLPRLVYAIDEAAVTYERAPNARLRRAQRLALRYTLSAPDGEVLADRRCQKARTDTIDRADRPALEDDAFPETQSPPPPPSGWRRYVKPALLVAATAVGVFLFFSIRSGEHAGSQ